MNAKVIAVSTLLVGVSLSAAACGSGSSSKAAAGSGAPAAPASSAPAAPSSNPAGSGPASQVFGPACSAVPTSGPGSFNGMATDPVATAASHNPVLSTLVTAVQKAGLVDTLNSAKDITVFAPTNDAFAKIPKATLDKVLADKKMLTSILTYHVVPGRKAPSDLAGGSFKTLQGGDVTTSGSGGDYTINGNAHVVCGNVPTGNATVYIVDSVLMPKG